MTNRTGQWIYQNGANFVYDDMNRVTQIEQEHAWAVFARSHYQYDRMGREEAVWRDEDSGRGERFEYEPNDQVKKAWYRAQNVWTTTPTNEVKNEEFTYTPDKLNRASVASNGVVTNYAAPNGLNQYPSVGNAAIGYDDHFNIASYHGATYIYDAQSRLVGGSMQATYDGLGRCVRRVTSAGTRLYTYDGWKPILEWSGNGSWQAWNIYGAGPDEILARNDATYGPTIYKLDKQGNVMALLDGSSNVVEKYFYDAFGYPTVTDHWGNETGHSSAYGNRFLFTGREYIAELGIYDYRHRMYHPGLGRFLQMDPTGFAAGDMNLFRYCGDDPVDRSDPTGLLDVNASLWNHQVWLDGGSVLSSDGFDYLKQGQARIDDVTGNFRDSNIDNHNPQKGEISTHDAGGTIFQVNERKTDNGILVIQPTLNWYVWPKWKFTDVVTRELEHVSRWLYWAGLGEGGAAVRSFNRHPSGAGDLQKIMKSAYKDEIQWQQDNIHRNLRHDASVFRPKNLDPEYIKKQIENVRPLEEPFLPHEF